MADPLRALAEIARQQGRGPALPGDVGRDLFGAEAQDRLVEIDARPADLSPDDWQRLHAAIQEDQPSAEQ